MSVELLQRRVRVARGLEPADLVLQNARIVNVFTGKIIDGSIAIVDGYIAAAGPFTFIGKETIDVQNRAVAPGFIDAHMHLESTMLTPAELAKVVVPIGTTAMVSDSHEIGNVLGIPGIELLIEAAKGQPLDLFLTASSCVPAVVWELSGATLGPSEVATLCDRAQVVALAEVMDFPAVLGGEPSVLAKIMAAKQAGRPLDGHAPGLTGLDLQAYAAVGIRSDHESFTIPEAIAKAELGMLVQVRDGSAARNLETLLPAIVAGQLGDNWCLVTDDIYPHELIETGHLDAMMRRLVAAGLPAADAIRHVSLVPARHYGLHDRGAVAAGYKADLVVLDDLKDFNVRMTFKNGVLAAENGKLVGTYPAGKVQHDNTVNVGPIDVDFFTLPTTATTCPMIGIIPDQIVTTTLDRSITHVNGVWTFDPSKDVAMIAGIERHTASGQRALGLVSGFGFTSHGAFGSSVAHDSHNLVIAGTNSADMLACVRALEESGGGFVVVADGVVKAMLPLPIAGLLSPESGIFVAEAMRSLAAEAAKLGCPLSVPFGTLSFLALPVIPAMKMTPKGMFDVMTQQFVTL